MRKFAIAAWWAAVCLSVCFPQIGWAGSTAYTNSDNTNNANTGVADNDMDVYLGKPDARLPIEFNINVASAPTTSATLTIYAYDVDEEQGENDQVTFNGHVLGKLTGANNVWSTTAFTIDPAWVVGGNNLVQVEVDAGNTGWFTTIDWGQLLLDGGSTDNGNASDVRIVSFSVNAGTVTINTQTTVQSVTGGNYRLETSIIDPNGNATSVLQTNFSATAGQSVTVSQAPTYALNNVSGTYTIQAQLFYINAGFPLQQNIDTAQFVHTANVGPTDNDNDGLTNTQETTLGTNPNNQDSDGDGALDAAEVGNVNSPTDSDGDGTINALESSITDTDGDGVANQSDAANTNPCIPNSNHAACLAADSDGDGLTNAQEDTLGTNRNSNDTDGDGALDAVEVGNVNSPTDSDGDGTINALESSVTDTDNDGVANQSDAANTNPCIPNANHSACLAYDSDGDGLTNGQEDTLGTNRNSNDTDGDGALDAIEVGNVISPTDSDGDGTINALESSIVDSDGDGVPNQSDPANSNPCVPNSNGAACLAADSDGDGLTNGQEDTLGTSRGSADTDGDGASDASEVGNIATPVDSDGDSAIDVLESSITDTDNDGASNQNDAANTNPCVPNANHAACLAYDTDGDGLTNGQEDALGTSRSSNDTDGDGALDAAEVGNVSSPTDSDSDGTIDALESSITDADNDGVSNQTDAANTDPCVPNSSHAACLAHDSDGDGLTNGQEDSLGASRSNTDTDGDGINDGVEVGNVSSPTDGDGDGIINALESSIIDTDGDGYMNQNDSNNGNPCVPDSRNAACLAFDSDGDGLTNGQENTVGTNRNAADSDGDGEGDASELGGNVNAPVDTDGDGAIDALESSMADTDGDGVNNETDIANTNPCMPNGNNAACLAFDSDGDGLTNAQEDALGTNRNSTDTDGDGVADGVEVGNNPNAPNDSDGDGIIDALETGSGDRDSDGTPDAVDTDSDNDGITDAIERGSSGTPRDSDNDGAPDYLDLDSDNDRVPDAMERGGNASPIDTDNDGLADYRDLDSDNDGLPDQLESNASAIDTDADGISDSFDVNAIGGADANNDGVSDAATLPDTNGDGIADLREIDSDHDGIADRVEGNATGVDHDSDGIDNAMDANFTGGADANNDGIDDSYAFPDTDGDGVADFRDLDTDNDSVYDVIEAGLIDADQDALLDAGQAVTYSPRDTDNDNVGDFRELDSDNNSTRDIVSAGNGSMDANNDGRIDGTTDADRDGIMSPRDTTPQVYGSFVDSDGDGVADAIDLDIDNDGIPNDADGGDDTDGDGVVNYMDRDSDNDGLTDTREAGGSDANGDGTIDNFADANNNGIADSVEPSRGGTALPVPDTDTDGTTNHRDVDSDGDGIKDIVEGGGVDSNDDGRIDNGGDSDNDGLRDTVDGSTAGQPMTPPDSDGDGITDVLDLDSDGDGFGDAQERTIDIDRNGVPDYRDSSSGKLGTATRGAGSFNLVFGVLLCLLAALRFARRRTLLQAAVAAFAFAIPSAHAADTAEAHKGEWYVGVDAGPSWLEPRNINAGYAIEDKSSFGYRFVLGHQTFEDWSIEAFYIDTGEAGIRSENPSIGYLGTVSYKLMGLGTEWTPFFDARASTLYPVLKVGLVHTENSTSDARIRYEVENEVSLYFGAAGIWKFAKTWRAQVELTSYDKDELMATIGVRKTFGGK